MNSLIPIFKGCAHQAGQICSLSNGELVRRFGLGDFLENKLAEADSAPDIAVKALEFFCDERNPHDKKFRFAVLTVGIFLQEHYAENTALDTEDLQQPLRDLVALLTQSPSEAQLRKWIESNFGTE
jgi:hypothetical protein